MATKSGYPKVLAQLKSLLERFEDRLTVTADKSGQYCLNAPFFEKYKREMFFGAVQVRKSYVSCYLMPVYMFPELLQGMSPALKAWMQGKSCFNFTTIEEGQLGELRQLTGKSFRKLKRGKLV